MGLDRFLGKVGKNFSSSEDTYIGGSGGSTRDRAIVLIKKVPLNYWIPILLFLLLAWMLGDLTVLNLRSYMIPHTAPPSKRGGQESLPYKPRAEYNDILARNIFNSDGFIPDVEVAGQNPDISGPAKESALPLSLVGTIVHANPGKSVATIQMKGNADKVLPYIPNDDIEGMATLVKVERKKAFIRNLSSGSLEYIEIKDDTAFAFKRGKPTVTQDGPVQKEGANVFAMSRGDLETQMSNLPDLLTQARALPNIVGGKVDGFKIVEVQENSLYSKLGIKNGDVIKGVNGEPIDSPAKAMELYNSLRNQSQVQLTVERNGQPVTQTYNIH